nr:SCP2 sterol-binding domain-containing protein [Halomonas populi]
MLASLERTLNTLLKRDPAAPARLARLAGSRLLICLETPHREVLIQFHEHGLHLQRADAMDEKHVDARATLSTGALAALASGESIERLMLSGRLEVRGRTALLEATRDLLLDLDLDWEGWLATLLGGAPAHQVAERGRRLAEWLRRSGQHLRVDISEFVFEEAKLLPGQQQLETARDLLTELEVATDRLEARLARLRRLINEETSR